MGTDCAPILADLFLDANFVCGLLNNKDEKWAQTFDSSLCYINDVLTLNNSWLGEYLHRISLYQIELGVEDTTGFQKSASYRLRLKIHNYDVMTSLSQKSTSHSLVEIFHQYQRMEFTFSNLYVILELIPSTVTYWTGLSCWQLLRRAPFLLCWSNSMVVIANWLTVTNINFLNGNGFIPFYVDFILFSYHRQDFNQSWRWVARLVSHKNRNCLLLANIWIQHQYFLWCPCFSSFQFSLFLFCLISFCVLCLMLSKSLDWSILIGLYWLVYLDWSILIAPSGFSNL